MTFHHLHLTKSLTPNAYTFTSRNNCRRGIAMQCCWTQATETFESQIIKRHHQTDLFHAGVNLGFLGLVVHAPPLILPRPLCSLVGLLYWSSCSGSSHQHSPSRQRHNHPRSARHTFKQKQNIHRQNPHNPEIICDNPPPPPQPKPQTLNQFKIRAKRNHSPCSRVRSGEQQTTQLSYPIPNPIHRHNPQPLSNSQTYQPQSSIANADGGNNERRERERERSNRATIPIATVITHRPLTNLLSPEPWTDSNSMWRAGADLEVGFRRRRSAAAPRRRSAAVCRRRRKGRPPTLATRATR